MSDLNTRKSISAHWWMNYLATISLLGALLLYLWMDTDKIKEGQSFVFMTFAANIFLAYLTSWFFLLVMDSREKRERYSYFKVHLTEILEECGSFTMMSWFVTHRVEAPFRSKEWHQTIRAILGIYIDFHKTVNYGKYREQVHNIQKFLSLAKSGNTRAIRKLRDRRSSHDDELFSHIDNIEGSLHNIPAEPCGCTINGSTS